jgi:hypothetical protein
MQNNGLDFADEGDGLAKRKQILVLEGEDLLTSSVISLLSSREEYDVSSVTFGTFESHIPHNSLKPDVIILEEKQVAANIKSVMDLVDRYPNVRLIVIGLGDNNLHIFDKQIVRVDQVSDFLELL